VAESEYRSGHFAVDALSFGYLTQESLNHHLAFKTKEANNIKKSLQEDNSSLIKNQTKNSFVSLLIG